MPLHFELTGKSAVLRSFLLPVGALLLLLVAGLSSSSEADEPLFVRSAQQLERLWSGVLGCTHPEEDDTRPTFETTLEDVGAPSASNHDYAECGRRALRNASSRMLVEAIEDAVRSGGVALSDQNFRLDSSIGWVWGENVTGEFDAVVPLWSHANPGANGQALFLQPGVVFWPGLEEEYRIDGNLGLVYRRKLATDVIMGGSVFYDRDFKQGNQRFGVGLDLQSNFLHTALNYYHPLNDWRRGARANYVEQPLQGADLRLEFAWPRIELDTSLGVWRFEGGEREERDWHSSFEVAAGFEVRPGVFLRGGYEKHSGGSLDSRWNAGLAFQFSLPGFEAARGGRSLPQAGLFEPVTREKRVLYEERLDFAVRLEVEDAFIVEPGNSGDRPSAATITGVISGRDLREEEALEVVLHESTTAEHGTGYDFVFSQAIYGVDVQTGERITSSGSAACAASPCRMAIPAGVNARTIEIEVSALDDSEPAEVQEHIDVRVDIRDGSGNLVHSSNVARVTIGAHGNTVGFASSSDGEFVENGGTATVTVNVNLPSPTPITLQVGAEGTARRGEDYRAPEVLAIPANTGSATLTLTGIDNDRPEGNKTINLALSGVLPEGWEYAANTHEVILRDDDLNIGFTASNPTLVEEGDGTVNLMVTANQPLPETVSVRWVVSEGTDELTGSTDGSIDFGAGDDGDDPQTIALTLSDDSSPENAEEVTVRLIADSLPEGWSLGDEDHTFTIEPSDGTITFAAAFSTLTINEGETRAIEITSTVNGPSGGYPLTVSISPDPSGQIDFPRTVRLPPGERRTSFAVTIIDDSELEEAQTYTISLAAADDAPGDWRAVSTRQEVAVPPSDGRISFASSRLVAEEGGSSVETTLVMNPPPALETVIPMSVTGNAVEGTDYTRTLSANGSNVAYRGGVVYPANAASVVFRVSALEDTDSDGESATYRITSFPEGYSVGTNGALQIALNDNDIGNVQFAGTGLAASASEGELVRLQVVASSTATEDLNLTWSVSPSGEVDSPSGGVVTVRQGSDRATFNVTIANPPTPDPEDAKDVTVTLDGPGLPAGWVLGGRSTHTINIPANDRHINFLPAAATVSAATQHYDLTLSLNETSAVALPISISAPGVTVSSPDSGASGNWNAGASIYTIPSGSDEATVRLDFPDSSGDEQRTYAVAFSEGAGFPSSLGWSLVRTSFALTVEYPDFGTGTGSVGFTDTSTRTVVEGGTVSLGVESTAAVRNDLPVTWTVNDDADGGDDIVTDSGTATILGSGNSATFSVAVADDSVIENSEDVVVTLSAGQNWPAGWTIGANNTLTVRIPANDRYIGFSPTADAVLGSTEHYDLVLSLNETSADDLPIRINVDDPGLVISSPDRAGNWNAGASTYTIPSGSNEAKVRLDFPDESEDGQKIYTVDFSEGASFPSSLGWSLADTSFALTVEYPTSGTVLFATDNPTTVDEGSSITLKVEVTGGSPGTAIDLDWELTDANNDITDDSGKVTIPANGTSVDIVIPTTDDTVPEPPESFTVMLADNLPEGFTLSTMRGSHEFSVNASDNTFTIGAPTTTSLAEGGDAASLEISFQNPPPTDAVLRIGFEDASRSGVEKDPGEVDIEFSADKNATYSKADGTLTIPAGAASPVTLTVAATQDDRPEREENFYLTPDASHANNSLPTGYTFANASHYFTIAADDNTIGFRQESIDLVEGYSNYSLYTDIHIDSIEVLASIARVTLLSDNPDVTILRTHDRNLYNRSSGELTIRSRRNPNPDARRPRGEDVDINLIVAEDDDAQNETATLTLSLIGGQTLPDGWAFGRTELTVNVADNDRRISFSPEETVLESAQHYDLTLSLNSTSTEALPIRISAPDGITITSPDTPGNWNATSDTYTIPVGSDDAKVRLDFPEDGAYDINTYTVNFSEGDDFPSAGGWSLVNTSFTLEVEDPAPGTVLFATGNPKTVEEGDSIELAVIVSGGGRSEDIELTWTVGDDGNDITTDTGTVTIRPASDRATFSIPTTQDSDFELTESFTVTLTPPDGGLPAGFTLSTTRATHEFGIVNDDIGGLVEITNDSLSEQLAESGTVTIDVSVTNGADFISRTSENVELEVGMAVVGDPDILADDRRNEPESKNDYTVGELVIDHETGTGSFTFTANNDNIPEGKEIITLTLADPDPGNLPNGWSVSKTKGVFTITVPNNDNAARFAEWPRSNPGSTGKLSLTLTEGEKDEQGRPNLIVLLDHIAPEGGLPLLISVPREHRGDIGFIHHDAGASTGSEKSEWNSANYHFTFLRNGDVDRAPNIAAGLEVYAVDNDGPEEEETFDITLMELSGFPRGWGRVVNASDIGSPQVRTSTTISVTIPENTATDTRVRNINFVDTSTKTASEGEVVTLMLESTIIADADLPVTWAVNDDADSDNDIVATGASTDADTGTVTIKNGDSSARFSITVVNDPDAESDEDVEITLTGPDLPTGWTTGTDDTLTVRIPANDRRISFSPTVTVLESTGYYDLTLSLNATNTDALPIRISAPADITISSPESGASSNWDAASNTYTIPSGSDEAKVRLDFPEDGDNDPATYTITFSKGDNFPSDADWSLAGTSFTLGVDDPASNTVLFAANNPTTVDEGDSIELRVEVYGGNSGEDIELTWTVKDDGNDIATDTGKVTVPATDNFVNITIPTEDDPDSEPAETFTVTLADNLPDGLTLSTTRGSHEFSINHSDNTGSIGFSTSASAFVEMDSGPIFVRYIYVTFNFGGGRMYTNIGQDAVLTVTATIEGDENDDLSDDFTFPATVDIDGDTGAFIFVPLYILRDDVSETLEVVTLTLSDPHNTLPDEFTLDPGKITHAVTIAPNDNTVEFASPSSEVGENGDTQEVTLRIHQPLAAEADVLVRIGGTADETDDYTITFSEAYDADTDTLTLPANTDEVTITVTGVNNQDEEGFKTIDLSLDRGGLPSGWVHDAQGLQSTHTVTIVDDDIDGVVEITNDSLSGTINESDTVTIDVAVTNSAAFIAATSANVELDVTMTVDGDLEIPWPGRRNNTVNDPAFDRVNDEATEAHYETEYTIGKLVIDHETGTGSFTFTAEDDDVAEGKEIITLTLADPDPGNLPDGWIFSNTKNRFTVNVLGNDNAARFSQWTRHDPGTVAELSVTLTEGVRETLPNGNPKPGFVVLLNHIAPEGDLPFLLSVPDEYKDDIIFENIESDRTRWDSESGVFTFRREANVSQSPNVAAGLRIFAVEDGVTEGEETFDITLMEASGFPSEWGSVVNAPASGLMTSTTFSVTIAASDNTVKFASEDSTVAETAGSHLVEVQVDKPHPDENITLNITTDGSATGGGVDYTVGSSVIIPATQDSANIPITIINDALQGEGNETIELTIEAAEDFPAGWEVVSPATHTVTIDAADNIVNLANLGSYRINEGDSVDVIVEVKMPLPADGSVVLDIEGGNSIDVVPLAGSTYSGGILDLSSGEGSAGIRITAIDDLNSEMEELVTFRISQNPADPLPDKWSLATKTQTLTIEPSDNTIGFAFLGDNRIEESESVDIMVEVDHPLPMDRSVQIDIDDDSGIDITPLAGSAYTNGNLRLAAGESSAGIRVTAKDDSDAEIAQDIIFNIRPRAEFPLPTGWGIDIETLPVAIEASDNTVSFAAPSSSTINERGSGNAATITATIDKPIPEGVSAAVAVTPAVGSAAQSGDYVLSVADETHGSVSGSIWTLPTEAGSATLIVTAVDNAVDAPDKTLTLGFAGDSLPTGWSVSGDVSHDITITDEDLTGTFQFAENQGAEAREGDVIALTVMASQTTEIDVPVTWTITAGGGDVIGADTGTVVIPSGEDTATFEIIITDDELAEYAETVTLVLSDAANDADLWTPDGRTEHDIEIFANDNIIRFEAPSSSSIAENGGVATITAVMDLPIPEDEPSDTNIRIKPGARVERGDLDHFDEHSPDYVLSAAEGNGTFVVLPREILTGRSDGIWTLPKGVERATLTVTAVDNTVSVAPIDLAEGIEDPDKTFSLGFSGQDLPRGWVVPAGTSHEITILDDALPDVEKNVAGLVLPGDGTEIVVAEGGRSSFEIKLSNADGTAYEAPVPGPFFTWFYTVSNTDVADIRDVDDEYDITFDGSGGWGPTFRAGRGNVIIVPGESHAGGLLPLTITITDDEITEGKEIFHHLFHEPRGSSGGLLDAERWRSDADANEFTLVILSSDNSVGFAQPASGDIPEAGGSTLITLAIAHPIDPGETVTVDLGFAGGTEGTDFEIVSGTATYDSTTKKLTLPTEASEATFTLEAVNNSAGGDSDKDIELTLSNPARAPIDGWGGLGTQTTHTVKIKSSTKNFIGFTKDAVAVAETVDTDATVMLQLSKPDGMPFTDPVPAGLSLAYSSPGNEDNDFSIQIDGAQAGSSTSAAGTVQIAEKAYANGLIPVTITVANDSKDEGVEEFVYTIAAPASPQLPMEWVVDGTNDSFTLVILASDSNVEFAESSSEDISENGGSARITINISNPIPDGETVTVALAVTDRDGAEGTGFTIVDGTAKYAAGKLTLPTGVTEADFTLQAQDNNTRGAEKNLTLTLSDLSGAPDGWAPDESNKLGDQTTHSVTIVDDDKNTIGFTKTSFSVGEDAGELSTVLLLSNGDGTPYTDSVPTDLSLRYTLAGTNRNDFSNEIEFAAAGTGASLGATGTLTIPHGHSIDKGEIPVTITITEDEIPENMEEFVYTIEASPSRFPEQDWRVDPGANRLTLVITDNDNSISIPGHNTIYNPRILEESAENLLIPVTLNAYAAQNITFNVAVRAEDHTTQRFPAGNDVEYTSTIEFLASDADNDASAPGHQQTENIVIEPVRDGMPENREEFYVTLRPVSPLPAGFVFPRPFNAPLNSPVIGYSTSAFAIPAHDNTITFDFNQPTTVAEGETITLNVRPLDNELPLDATFRVTSDAEDPSDITITPNPVTLPEGLAGNKSFTVTANQDADAVSEFITLRLVPNREFPAGWGITNEIYAIHRITIEDDETATVLFDPTNRTKLREAEGEVSLRVNFENGVAPAGGVGLSLTSSDPALVRVPGEASSFTIEEGHDGFAFTVDVLADGNAVKDTVTLTLRKGTDGNGAGFPDDWSFKGDAGRLTLELEIGDRGTIGFAEPSDSFAEPSTTFAEPDSVADKQKALLQISPDHRPTRAFTLAFHLTSNGAVNDRNTGDFFVDTLYTVMPDKVSSFGTIEYPVLILPDDEYERDESFTLTLAENQPDLSEDEWYIDPDKASYTVTIPINDIPSGNTLGFTAPTMTVKERTGEVQIEVVSSAPAPSEGLPLQVALAKSAGSRTVFTGAPTATTYNITIGPGESSTSFPVSIFDDASEWADEEVTFTLSLQNNFPSAWGTGTESGTITTSTLVLTIDDRDDGVIGIVDPRPVFREPYPGEPTYQSGYKHAIDHYFEVSISEIPRRGFNLGFASAVPRPNVKPYVLIYEINFRTQWWVTPEDAADGKILVPFGIARDGDLESTEYYGVRMVGNSLPGPGWRIGQHPRFDYSLLDSNGGQIWFPPNDTQVGNVLCNPSFIREAQSPRARMCLMADSHGADSPVRVNVVGSADAAHDDDFRFSDEIRIVRGNTTLLHFPFGLPEDNKREEDRTYTLIAEEAPGFPGHGRRIDPARNLYTFTVPANGGSIDFHPSNSTTLTEGEGMRQLSLELEGGATPTNGINLSLVSSNPAIVDIPATYRNFTIPASSLFNYSFSVDVKTDSNTTDDIVTLTLRKGADLPGGWEFKGGAAELTMDFAVIDASSTPSNGTIQFSNSGFTEFEPETNPVSGINNRKRGRIPLRVSPPPLVAFDLPIEVSGSASFGIADQTCTTGCLDGTYDVTRDWRGDFQGSPNALLPLESSGADTVFARIKPSAGNTTNLDFLINDDTHFEGTETFILTIPEDALLPDGFTLGEHKRFVLTISANDNAVQFSSGESSVTEGGLHNTVAINFTTPLPPGTSASIVMRSALNGGASANDYFVSGVTGGSYNAGTNTFTALAGTDSLTFNFSANDDTIADPGESVTFTLDANASSFPENWGGIGSQTSHTVTIRDDEVTSIGFAGGTVEEPDSEGDTAILLVNASANIGNDPAEFEWTVSPAEYVTNPTGKAALTSRNYVLEIMAKDDNIAELAKEVTVTLTDGDTNDIWTIDEGSATRTFTIPASDNTVTFAAPSPAIISENGGVATITAAINRPALSGGAPVVAITPSGSANSGDYSFSVAAGNGSLSGNTWTLPTGTDSATLTVTTADNNNDDSGNKTLTLGFADAPSMPTGWNVSGTASRTITITDDDDAASTGTVQFAHASSNATEGAGDAVFHVPLLVTGTPAAAFDLKINVVNGGEDGAATEGRNRDFTVPATLSISRSGSANLEVSILADALSEFDETIVLEIPSGRDDNGIPAGFNLGATARHTVTIGANGNTVGFEPGNPLVITDIGARGHLTVNVNNKIAVAGHTVRVEVDGVGGEPPANDYQITQDGGSVHVDVLSLPADKSVTTIGIATVGNAAEIVAETVTLTLVEQDLPDGWNVEVANSTYSVSVNDTIEGNTLGFAASASTVKEQAGNVQMEVRTSAPAPSDGLPLTVTLARGTGSKVAFPGDASATSHDFTIAEGETRATFPITLGDDASESADEEVTFTLALGEDFPNGWGVGSDAGTITTAVHTLTIDDRDDGVIGFVNSMSEFREPYPGEATVKNAQYDTIYHPVEMHISEIPRQGFDLRFLWGYPSLRPLASALHHEVHFPYTYRVTPEDAADGRFSVPFGVARDAEEERTEYFRLRMNAGSLPAGWSIGEHPHLDYAVLDSFGGQIWFAPNDTRVGSTTYNPSTITENDTDHTVKVRITTDAINIDAPVIVELEDYTSGLGSAVRHPDIHPTNFPLVVSSGVSSVRSRSDGTVVWDVEFDLTIRADNQREEDETYTLVLKEGSDFPFGQHGRRIDPERNKYTFTIPANDNSIPAGSLVSFAASAPAEAAEGGRAINVPIVISDALPEEVTLTVSVSGNAEEGDYTIHEGQGYDPGTGTLTLSRNATEGRLTLAANSEDSDDTDDETVRIELTGELPEGYSFWNHVHTINIREPRTVQFTSAETRTIYEGETTTANLRLSKALIPDVTIPLLVSGNRDAYRIEATSSGGASVDVDGQKVDVNFGPSGRYGFVTLTMTASEDSDFDDESITVSIDEDNLPLGHSAIAGSTWTVNMIDNDKTIEFLFHRVEINEPAPGEPRGHRWGGGTFGDTCAWKPNECVEREFFLLVKGIPDKPFDVKFRKYTNSEGGHFHFFWGTEWGYPRGRRISHGGAYPSITVSPPGSSRGTVSVPILVRHDDEPEGYESWGLKILSNGLPRGWSLGPTRDLTVVIACNDGHNCQ